MSEKPYTFHFYQLVPVTAEKALRALFDRYLERGTNIPHAGNNDHYIQVQNLHKIPADPDCLVSGVVKKFTQKDHPKIGETGKSRERPIDMSQDEALIDKTYFLYSFSHHVLLYQTNVRGTSCKQFSNHLAAAALGSASFEPLLTREAYKILTRGDHTVKNFQVTIPTPTSSEMVQTRGDSNDWEDFFMSFLKVSGGTKLKIGVTAGSGDRTLTAEAKNLLISLMDKFSANQEVASSLRGKVDLVELIDGQYVSHSLDLVANRISATVNIPMIGRYPDETVILTKMMNIMVEKEPEFCAIVGYG